MYRMNHMAGWSRVTFWMMTAVILCLWVSGFVMYLLPVEAMSEMTSKQEELRRASGIFHGVASWLFCVMLGRGVWPHVRVMWHRRTQRVKWGGGVINLIMLTFLATGGLILLYGSPLLHDALSPWHFWVGALGPFIYLKHTWRRFLPRILSR